MFKRVWGASTGGWVPFSPCKEISASLASIEIPTGNIDQPHRYDRCSSLELSSALSFVHAKGKFRLATCMSGARSVIDYLPSVKIGTTNEAKHMFYSCVCCFAILLVSNLNCCSQESLQVTRSILTFLRGEPAIIVACRAYSKTSISVFCFSSGILPHIFPL
jgi:hypothetical protein